MPECEALQDLRGVRVVPGRAATRRGEGGRNRRRRWAPPLKGLADSTGGDGAANSSPGGYRRKGRASRIRRGRVVGGRREGRGRDNLWRWEAGERKEKRGSAQHTRGRRGPSSLWNKGRPPLEMGGRREREKRGEAQHTRGQKRAGRRPFGIRGGGLWRWEAGERRLDAHAGEKGRRSFWKKGGGAAASGDGKSRREEKRRVKRAPLWIEMIMMLYCSRERLSA